jgi:hypothetical protein
MAAVGRATFSLKKKHSETAWTKLLHPSQSVPQNMHTWWAMKEQHENEVKSLDTSLTDASAIKKAEKERAENGETGEDAAAGEEVAKDDDTSSSSSTAEAGSTPESAEASVGNSAFEKLRIELEKEKMIARGKILFSTKKSSEEIEEKFLIAIGEIDAKADEEKQSLVHDVDVERTNIQRGKAEALQTMQQDYALRLQALESNHGHGEL